MTNRLIIDSESCSMCGICFEICPAGAISWAKGELPSSNPQRIDICISCGQCMAICPSKSIFIHGLDYERDFMEIGREHIGYQDFMNLASGRRSIRSYKNKAVPREMLEQIAEAIAQSPMGFPPHKTEITIIQERTTIDRMLPVMISFYEQLVNWFNSPLKRFFIRRDAGPETYATMQGHLIPILKTKMPDMKKGGRDEISRGAPAMILFHARKLSEHHTPDAYIALTYGLLAAHSLGLGASAISLIPPVINRSPELRQMLQFEEDQEVVAAMIVGYPRYRFQRGIKRPLARVRWL